MFPTISLRSEGLFDPARLDAWTSDRQRRLRNAAVASLKAWGRDTASALNDTVRSAMKVKRKQFPGFRARVFAEKADRMPSVLIGSKVPWLGVYGRGGTIRPASARGLLIPLLEGRRIGPKAFRRVITTILRNGAGFFKEVNGRVILFAEYQAEYGQPLARFRRAERARLGSGAPRKWAGQSIPIAVLVPSVEVRKRFDIEREIRRRLPKLVQLLETNIARASPVGL